MNILEKIIQNKRQEVAARKADTTYRQLESAVLFQRPAVSIKKSLLRLDLVGIIAEIKRKSPSAGWINTDFSLERTAAGYLMAGASALSVITDHDFFGGSNEDIVALRRFVDAPILRKEFIVDEFQVIETKAIGADAILLIAKVLDNSEIQQFAKLASSIGLEVLLEISDEAELKKLNEYVDLAGVNNRSLEDFTVDVQRSFDLASSIPDDFVKISESGLRSPSLIDDLKQVGFRGFLMGEHFMKDARPDLACAHFIHSVETLQRKKILV